MRRTDVIETPENWRVDVSEDDGSIITFYFSEIERFKRSETQAYVETFVNLNNEKERIIERYTTRLNLASMSARRDFATVLRNITGDKRPYDAILSAAVVALLERLNAVKKAVPITEITPEIGGQSMLFYPFLTDNSANLIFGNGESTKTYITTRIALSLVTGLPFLGFTPAKKCKVLFLDYEDRGGKFADRVMKIVSGMKPSPELEDIAGLHYMKANGVPLVDLVSSIKEEMRRVGATVLLIDSAGYAAGAELERAETAIRYFNALDAIGVTSLAIAHVSKGGLDDDKGQKFALGSIYFHNGPRNTWNVVKLGEENDEEPVKKICLFHRKCNDGPRHPMIPLEVDFSAPGIVSFRLGDPDDWEEKQSTADRVISLLKAGPMGRSAIEQNIGEASNTVKVTLRRLVRSGRIILLGGKGGEYVLPKNP